MNSNSSAYFPIFALAKRTQVSKSLVELNSEAPQVIRNDNHQMEQDNNSSKYYNKIEKSLINQTKPSLNKMHEEEK